MVRFRMLLVATIASLSAIQSCAPVVQGVKQEETVLRFKMKSLAGQEVDLAKALSVNKLCRPPLFRGPFCQGKATASV